MSSSTNPAVDTAARRRRNEPSPDPATSPISDAENRQLLQYGIAAFGALLALRVVAQTSTLLATLLLPGLYLYLVSTCPDMNTFDAKKELKRVLRGHHLPDTHPSKPKDFLSETVARVAASVTTEAMMFTGYEIETLPLANAIIVQTVRVPSAKLTCYWVGAANKWWYITSVQDAEGNKTSSS